MEKKILPPDFDWVTERRKCSAEKVYESLLAAARRNVEAMKTVEQDRVRSPVEMHVHSGSFAVMRTEFGRKRGTVRVYVEGQQIIAESDTGDISLKADLTLNDDGECRLLVDGKQLQEWQFLRAALEPLFFLG